MAKRHQIRAESASNINGVNCVDENTLNDKIDEQNNQAKATTENTESINEAKEEINLWGMISDLQHTMETVQNQVRDLHKQSEGPPKRSPVS